MIRSALSSVLIAISVLPALAQSGEDSIFIDLVTTCSVNVGNATDSICRNGALDFITSTVEQQDMFSVLEKVIGSNRNTYTSESGDSHAGMDIMDMISGAYVSNGYYETGAWDNYGRDRHVAVSSILPPLCGICYYYPEWGKLTSRYGYREQFHRMHHGIDIAMRVGDSVRAALPGIVAKVSFEANGYGHYMIIVHDNDIETCYAHLCGCIAAEGQRVEAREVIALSGNSGNSTGPHLHFETRYRGASVDPEAIFVFSPVIVQDHVQSSHREKGQVSLQPSQK